MYPIIQCCHCLRYSDLGKLRAAAESVETNGGKGIGQGDIVELYAIVESIIVNAGKGVGKMNTFQRVAVGESIASYRSDWNCDVDGIQSVTVVETVTGQGGEVIFEGDVLDWQLVESKLRQALYNWADIDVLQRSAAFEGVVAVGFTCFVYVSGVAVIAIILIV